MPSEEAVRDAQQITAYLVRRRVMNKNSDEGRKMLDKFHNNEETKSLVCMQGEAFGVQIAEVGNAVYMIPNAENTVFGFSRYQLKTRLVKGKTGREQDAEYCLDMFAILVLLQKFYGGHGISLRTRTLLSFDDWQNAVADALKEGARREGGHGADGDWLDYTELSSTWNSMLSTEEISRKKNTKESILSRVVGFLNSQGLTTFLDGAVRVTPKLDDFMQWLALNRDDPAAVARLEQFLGASGGEAESEAGAAAADVQMPIESLEDSEQADFVVEDADADD